MKRATQPTSQRLAQVCKEHICPEFDVDCLDFTPEEASNCKKGGLKICRNGILVNVLPILNICPMETTNEDT